MLDELEQQDARTVKRLVMALVVVVSLLSLMVLNLVLNPNPKEPDPRYSPCDDVSLSQPC